MLDLIQHLPLFNQRKEKIFLITTGKRETLSKNTSGWTYLITTKAFTLIELLVVVLIIGILAAIAVPQYQKAVTKSRLTQDAVVFNTLAKGIDSYLLANGFPSERVWFVTGEHGAIPLDVTVPWASCKDNCQIGADTGTWSAHCVSSQCNIFLWSSSLVPHTNINYKRNASDSEWLFSGGEYTSKTKSVCQFIRDFWGTNKMDSELKTACAGLGIQ